MATEASVHGETPMNTPRDHVRLSGPKRSTTSYHADPSSSDRHHPPAPERWRVGDVVVHLATCAELYADSICRGLQGDITPPPGFPPPGIDMATAAERIAQGAIARRQHLGDQVLATFASANARLHHLLSHLGPQAWELPCYHPARVRPVRSLSTCGCTS